MRAVRTSQALALLVAAGLLSAHGGASAAGPMAADAPTRETKVSVVSLGDIRGDSAFSKLQVKLELPDFAAAEVAGARIVVRKAVDDTGRDLLREEDRKAPLEPIDQGSGGGAGEKPAPAVLELNLRNPARKAKVLRALSGEIELYLPGRDPQAVARIPRFASFAGRTLESPALAASGVTLAYLTAEQFEAEKKTQAAKRKEEAKKSGVLGEMLEPLASAFLSAFFSPSAGDVILKIGDPGGRLVQLRLVDAAGEDKTSGRAQQQDLAVLSSSARGPEPDWSLEVRLKTSNSLERRSFSLTDVPLP